MLYNNLDTQNYKVFYTSVDFKKQMVHVRGIITQKQYLEALFIPRIIDKAEQELKINIRKKSNTK